MKSLKVDLEPYNINGVVHVGAGTGEFAEYYHKLGVHKVLWLEAELPYYNALYENTKRFGMDQEILIAQLDNHDSDGIVVPQTRKFLSVWRENASFLPMDTYDVLHVACAANRIEILKGFDFLLEGFKEVVFSGGSGAQDIELEKWLSDEKFTLSNWNTDNTELLFVNQRG